MSVGPERSKPEDRRRARRLARVCPRGSHGAPRECAPWVCDGLRRGRQTAQSRPRCALRRRRPRARALLGRASDALRDALRRRTRRALPQAVGADPRVCWGLPIDPAAGPAHASGWNCTEKIGRVWWMMPSLVPSLALTKNCVQPSGSEFGSTAKPWFLSGHGQQDQAAGRQGASGIRAPRPLFSGPGQPRASGRGLGGGGRPHGLRAGEGTLSMPSFCAVM